MGILHVSGMGTPGGQEHQVYEFIRHTEEKYNHNLVVASDPIHDAFEPIRQTSTSIISWKYYLGLKVPKYPSMVRRWLLQRRLDDFNVDVAIGYNLLSRRTLFSSLHSNVEASWLYYDGCGMWLDSPGEVSEVLNQYDLYGALCPASAFLMREKFGLPEHRIELLPYSVSNRYLVDDETQKQPSDTIEENSSIPEARLRLLFVGRLIARKGVNTLIRAMQGLDSSVKLLIVGDGPEREHLERLTKRLGVSNQSFFYGFQADPYRFYQAADLFVFPTTFEPFGKVVVEAGAMGLPVITTNVDGPSMMVDHGRSGFLIRPTRCVEDFREDFHVQDFPDHVVDMDRKRITEPRMVDPSKLEERIRFYLENPGVLEDHGQALQDEVRETFSMGTFQHRIKAVFDRLVETSFLSSSRVPSEGTR